MLDQTTLYGHILFFKLWLKILNIELKNRNVTEGIIENIKILSKEASINLL